MAYTYGYSRHSLFYLLYDTIIALRSIIAKVHLPDQEKDKGQQNQGGQHSSSDCPLSVRVLIPRQPRGTNGVPQIYVGREQLLKVHLMRPDLKGLSRSAHHSTMLKAIKREMKNKSTSKTQGSNGRPSNKIYRRQEINAWWA